MKFWILLSIFCVGVFTEDPLRKILRSPGNTLKLYKSFKLKQHLNFDLAEDRARFRLFRKNAEEVASYNEDPVDNAHYVLNFFSTMTQEEKKRYLGYNVTKGPQTHESEPQPPLEGRGIPEKVLWTNQGYVTPPREQGECGSCWTFGAVAGLETRYRVLSGVLRKFAEQEYLDCVYEGEDDGCNGGTMYGCYSYSRKVGGRLAADKDYRYTQRDGWCQSSRKPDAMIAYKIQGYIDVGKTEQAHLQALTEGSVGVAFEVTDKFHQYGTYIMKDTTCVKEVNHAVAMVGYTSKFILVKNSWGSDWGDRGFVRFVRNHHNCRMYYWSSYPKLVSTGRKDTGRSDPATNYRPREDDDYEPNPDPNPGPNPNCKDVNNDCHKWKNNCKSNGWINYMKQFCAKTCNYCSDDGGQCPSGTVRCPDGKCRHPHMC